MPLRDFIAAAYERGNMPGADGELWALMPHSIDEESGTALRDLARAEGVARTLEVGLALGIGTLWLCEALEGVEGAAHVTLDPLNRDGFGGAGLRAIEEAGLTSVVEVVEEESQTELPRMIREGREFDLAYVDGDHRFESAFLDIYFCGRLVKPGGLVVVDDLSLPALRAALDYFETNMGYERVTGILPDEYHRDALRRPRGNMAVLRVPVNPPERHWNSYESFAA
ncbi:MAG: class I SAM-dependent methyltransferase [Thermoleophilaceae bacterium]|nr:class I SAM-dependent methyltransferase [Thermoleophilaceae bacterium]